MAQLLALGIIYKALEKYHEETIHEFWSQAMFEAFGRPNRPGCAVKALAIVKHDRVLTGRTVK